LRFFFAGSLSETIVFAPRLEYEQYLYLQFKLGGQSMRRSIFFASALVVLLVALLAFAQHPSSRANTTDKVEWEYLVVVGGRHNLASTSNNKMAKLSLDGSFREHFPLEMNLDKLGVEGWELVTVTMTREEPIYYLKRLKAGAR
jgi:hypothetical protein